MAVAYSLAIFWDLFPLPHWLVISDHYLSWLLIFLVFIFLSDVGVCSSCSDVTKLTNILSHFSFLLNWNLDHPWKRISSRFQRLFRLKLCTYVKSGRWNKALFMLEHSFLFFGMSCVQVHFPDAEACPHIHCHHICIHSWRLWYWCHHVYLPQICHQHHEHHLFPTLASLILDLGIRDPTAIPLEHLTPMIPFWSLFLCDNW